MFTLELSDDYKKGSIMVDIYGMNGVKVLSQDLSDGRKHFFAAESLRPGMYFIQVTTASSKEIVKLVKL
jgi:hypothetical protein